HSIPDEYGAVVEEGAGWPSDRLERERLGFSASEAGELILRAWGVPELLILGSSYADRRDPLPSHAPYARRKLAALVALARLGTSDVFGDERAPETPWFATEAQSRFGLTPDGVREIVADLDDECFAAADMLAIELPEGVSYQALLEQAGEQVVPLTVDALMQLDRSPRTFVPADWA